MAALFDRPWLLTLLRFRYAILIAWAARWFPTSVTDREGDWSFFADGSSLLFSDEGLHLYANHPELHMGPLSLTVAPIGQLAAHVLMWGLGLATILLVERTAVAARGGSSPLLRLATLLGGLVFFQTWMQAAGPMSHLDDVLTMAAGAVAVWGVATRRPWAAGLAVGVAIGAKSWGVLFLPILFALPGARLRAFAPAFAVAGAAWLPFVLGDLGTLASLDVAQANDPASALRALGVDAEFAPSWTRPVQVALGLALALLAVRRGRWAAALVLAIGARIALDPQVFGYYTPTLVFGALVWDLVGARKPLPAWTLVTFGALYSVPEALGSADVLGFVRLGAVAACAAGALFLPGAGVSRFRDLPRVSGARLVVRGRRG